jgi:hypothetical protein
MVKNRPSRVEPIVESNGETTVIKTGIYQRTIKSVDLTPVTLTVGGTSCSAFVHGTCDEMKARFDAWNAEPQRTLGQVREHAISFFRRHAVEVIDKNNPPFTTSMVRHDLGDGLRDYQLPEDAPPIARDAVEVLNCLEGVEIDGISPAYKVFYAFKLGRLYERMLVRQLEHRALVGMRKAKRNARIAKSRELSHDELRRRYQAVQDELATASRRGERVSRERAYQTVATRLNLSKESIKRAFLEIDRGG